MKNIKNIIEQKYPPENPNDLWMKDNVLYKSTHKGWTPLTVGGSSSANGVTSTTWLELKDKRDNGQLIPGSLYRITDYNCTTTQENTKSAGHQFDIVLLALSANKLAEEGWAMMNESNIYDVTFYDGFTKKCYLYVNSIYDDNEKIYESWNLIDIDTMLGIQLDDIVRGESAIVDDNNKQISFTEGVIDPIYFALDTPNLTYNYFQNSNLSAWKVWYCLDNDKSRFTWADDSVSGDVTAIDVMYIGNTYERDNSLDGVYQGIQLYSWRQGSSYIATEKLNPLVGDYYYDYQEGEFLQSADTVTKITIEAKIPNGRGVIYRLIDEWNNDVGYDFKNIQFVRPLTDGVYDPDNGEDTWVYTFSHYNEDTLMIEDGSIPIPDIGVTSICNIVKSQFELNNNVLFDAMYCEVSYDSENLTLTLPRSIVTIGCDGIDIIEESQAIYLHNQKVLTES